MNLEHFSRKNRERCEAPNGFNHKLTDWSLSDSMTAVMGEVGEAANIVKKLNRVRDGIRGNKQAEEALCKALVRELADSFVYLDLMMQRLGTTTTETITKTFNDKSVEINSEIRL